jgi:hypothetical protein
VIPEIHVSYFTPLSLSIAYGKVGLKAVDGHYGPGWTDIIRFKILKNLGMKKRSWIESLLPWSLLSRLVDGRYRVSAQPLAVKSWSASAASTAPKTRLAGDLPLISGLRSNSRPVRTA